MSWSDYYDPRMDDGVWRKLTSIQKTISIIIDTLTQRGVGPEANTLWLTRFEMEIFLQFNPQMASLSSSDQICYTTIHWYSSSSIHHFSFIPVDLVNRETPLVYSDSPHLYFALLYYFYYFYLYDWTLFGSICFIAVVIIISIFIIIDIILLVCLYYFGKWLNFNYTHCDGCNGVLYC